MNNKEFKAEAVNLVKEFDAGRVPYVEARSAADLADFWIEYQFARIDIDCDWNDAKCTRMHKRMFNELKALGLP